MSYNSESKLRIVREKLEGIIFEYFKETFSILALDTTYFFTKSDLDKIQSDIVYTLLCDTQYIDILNKEVFDKHEYASFNSNYTKFFCNLHTSNNYNYKYSFLSNKKSSILLKNNFNPDEWHKVLIDKRYGGCSIILSKSFEEVQCIIYLLLDKPLPSILTTQTIDWLKLNSNLEISNDTKDCINSIFIELENLMIEEVIHYIYKDRQQFQYTIELINLEKKIIELNSKQLKEDIDSYGHIIFNSLGGNAADLYDIIMTDQSLPISTITKKIENINKRNIPIGIFLRLIGNRGKEIIEDFRDKNNLKAICDFIMETYILSNVKQIIYSYDCSSNFPLKEGSEGFVFILLWNLLKNSDRHSEENNDNSYFNVCIKNNMCVIIFKNISSEKAKNILQSIINNIQVLKPRKGMWAILNAAQELGWVIKLKDDPNPGYVELWVETSFIQL